MVQQWKPEIREPADQGIEAVLVFGEDQEPLHPAREMIGNDRAKLLELGFGGVLLCLLCQPNEPVKLLDFRLQLGHVLGHREPLDDVILEVPTLGFRQIVQILGKFAKLLLELAEFAEIAEPS